jgi:Glycosyl hydrolases family 15
MHRTRAAAVVCVGVAAALALSGGSRADPATPPAIPGMPPPFLGTALVGDGRTVGAVDSYGNVVDVRPLGPGPPRLQIPAELQAAGTVPADSGILARAHLDRARVPFWDAEVVHQSYLPGTNVLRTVARFGDHTATVVRRLGGPRSAAADRRWLAASRPLGGGAPAWARRMYARSLLVLRALTDRRSGATIAGARDGWAYVWPRDAATVAIALAAAGHRAEARRVVDFLDGLDLEAAARFDPAADPVDGRSAQGDATGWVAAADRAVGFPTAAGTGPWGGLADYQEKDPGDYLGNAIAAGAGPRALAQFESREGLVREAGSASGLDAAAAWAVRPFPRTALLPAARRTLLRLVAQRGRFGITPSQDWPEGDPWTAPTAWCAWSLATLGERRPALELMADLRRAATPLGLLPERVGAQTGIPRSTTPLAWSHAFAILALRALWP